MVLIVAAVSEQGRTAPDKPFAKDAELAIMARNAAKMRASINISFLIGG
jgi:hypothetical protein